MLFRSGTGLVAVSIADGALSFTAGARTANVPGEGQLKVGWFGEHTSYCDEPEVIGGGDEFPPPLGYLSLALGWCALTQVTRIAEMRSITLDRVEAFVEMDWKSTGSLADGSARTGSEGIRIRFEIDSDAPADEIERMIVDAEAGCYVENLIRGGSTITSEISHNGNSLPPPS